MYVQANSRKKKTLDKIKTIKKVYREKKSDRMENHMQMLN